jgi:predicted metal-dependent hydrolase
MESLTVDDLTFEVRRSPRRRTVEITLDRGGALIISAPPDTDETLLADFVREKRFWLYTKMAEKASHQRPLEAKELVSGEGFPYLGRSYRLLLVDEQDVPLKLEAGRFKLLRPLAAEGREPFVRWYTEHARHWLRQRVKAWAARMGVEPEGVEVRDLGFRWGSCSQAGNLNFHWATILLPPSIVDYVIVHELAHLVEPNHTPEFWLRVGRALPEYEQRKVWLAEHGGRHLLL